MSSFATLGVCWPPDETPAGWRRERPPETPSGPVCAPQCRHRSNGGVNFVTRLLNEVKFKEDSMPPVSVTRGNGKYQGIEIKGEDSTLGIPLLLDCISNVPL